MKHALAAMAALIFTAGGALADSFASAVVSYELGTTSKSRYYFGSDWTLKSIVPLNNPAATLGKPATFVNEPYDPASSGIVSPFVPPANEDQIFSLGAGGQITLRLDHYALVDGTSAPEIGLFTNTMATDANDGQETIAGIASGRNVIVKVSQDGLAWVSLGTVSVGMINNPFLDAPSAYAKSAAGLTEANFSKPFTGAPSDLVGKTYVEATALLNGSAGGTWLDLSSTGLVEVGYIQLIVPAGTATHIELDAVSVNGAMIGQAVLTPEPATLLALLALGAPLLRRRRSSRQG